MKYALCIFSFFSQITPIFAGPEELLFNPKPQYVKDSCRSYALAYSLGTMFGPPYAISTVKELRVTEQNIEQKIRSVVERENAKLPVGTKEADKYSNESHSIWAISIAELTNKKVVTKIEYIKEPGAWTKRVEELTGNAAADTWGAHFSATIVKTPVFTSVTEIAKSKFKGHIVTIFGVAAPPSNQSATWRPLAVLNGAINVKDKIRKTCEAEVVTETDLKWSAAVSLEDSYKLKSFSDGYLVMYLAPGP